MSRIVQLLTMEDSFRDILGNGKHYIVPKYQRDYSWNYEQWENLWEDIELVLQDREWYHYMGYIILQKNNDMYCTIIDGQQRIATFSLIVIAAIKRLEEYAKNNDEEHLRINEIHKKFLGSKDIVKLRMTNKLRLNRNNDYYYTALVEGRDIQKRGAKRTVQLMQEAVEYFYNQLKNKPSREIARIIEKISTRLIFTSMYIANETNAYQLFETLNARGSQLSSSDLLKNYLFTIIDRNNNAPNSVLDKFDRQWDRIGEEIGNVNYSNYILCQWNSEHSPLLRKVNLFACLQEQIREPAEAEAYLNVLESNSPLYAALHNYEHEFWKHSENMKSIKENIRFLQIFGIHGHTSLLYISHIKQRSNFAKILEWIAILSFRYNVICMEHVGEQEKLYNSICQRIFKGCEISEIKSELLKIYPQDSIFTSNFIEKTVIKNKEAHYILARLAEHTSKIGIDNDATTVEHILPVNANETWIDYFGEHWQNLSRRIGNLALVSPAENKKLGQSPFSEKQKILMNSPFNINTNISRFAEWSSQSIESRQAELANSAVQIWRIN